MADAGIGADQQFGDDIGRALIEIDPAAGPEAPFCTAGIECNPLVARIHGGGPHVIGHFRRALAPTPKVLAFVVDAALDVVDDDSIVVREGPGARVVPALRAGAARRAVLPGIVE